jgi:hypothetical protein
VQRDVGDIEHERQARGQSSVNQVLDDFVLSIDGDAAPAGQVRQVDAVMLAGKAKREALMPEAFAPEPVAEAYLGQQIDRVLLQDAGPDTIDHVLARTGFDHDRVDPGATEQVSEQQPRGAATDDADLCADPGHGDSCAVYYSGRTIRVNMPSRVQGAIGYRGADECAACQPHASSLGAHWRGSVAAIRGCRVLLVDGDPMQIAAGQFFCAQCMTTRFSVPTMVASWVTAENVNALITEHGFAGDIDLLPYSPHFRADLTKLPYKVGASLPAFVALGRAKGYRLVGLQSLGFNAFFVQNGKPPCSRMVSSGKRCKSPRRVLVLPQFRSDARKPSILSIANIAAHTPVRVV